MTELSTSTTHRLLRAMAENGLVHQDSAHRYSLGPLIVQLARNGALPTTLREAALPVMTRVRDQVNETVGLHELMPNGYRAVIDQVESHQDLRRSYTEFGIPLPLPHGAPGRTILAFLSEDRQRWWLDQELPPDTSATVVTSEAVLRDIAATRSRGWAHPLGERTPGIRSVAAPVFDHSHQPIGALSISVPAIRMSTERAHVLGPLIAEAAWEVSQILGASERPWPTSDAQWQKRGR
ncbi:IclR family transcriptional regulator [Nesterenkonia sp. MY13]|uniref:IclR family transcriptional regulator n=1 Tax=Nesterenkonia sedimenti TaxID=1463632 RepID=A0A7X8TIU8_9MICC|nr:IclR family transcriptional regulator [Nesterenkonia sedimenti]